MPHAVRPTTQSLVAGLAELGVVEDGPEIRPAPIEEFFG